MKLDIPDIAKIVKVNELPEIKNPFFLDKDGRPLDDGLYSYTIFGRLGSEQRKTQFAYIDLHVPFIHPVIHNSLIKLDRSIGKVISGMKWVKLNRGGFLEEVEEGSKEGGTGIDFLYRNWENIKFKGTESDTRQERLDFILNFPRNEAFITNWLVIPPHFRDLDTSAGKAINTDVLTSMYAKLISHLTIFDRSADLLLTGNLTRAKIQEIIIDIYSYFTMGITMRNGTLERKGTTGIAGKRGLIHRSLLAKNIDYTARAVISCTHISSANRYDEQAVPYGYTGLPLHVTLTCFFPFIQHELTNYSSFYQGYDLIVKDDKKETVISPDNIKKFVKMFIGTREKRLLPIFLRDKNGKLENISAPSENGIVKLDLTITDLFYMLAKAAVGEGVTAKHILLTRYPIED
jgi:DNA-directed RNA polymerase beta' subunit